MNNIVGVPRELLESLVNFFFEDEDYRRDSEQFLLYKLHALLDAQEEEPVAEDGQ